MSRYLMMCFFYSIIYTFCWTKIKPKSNPSKYGSNKVQKEINTKLKVNLLGF